MSVSCFMYIHEGRNHTAKTRVSDIVLTVDGKLSKLLKEVHFSSFCCKYFIHLFFKMTLSFKTE